MTDYATFKQVIEATAGDDLDGFPFFVTKKNIETFVALLRERPVDGVTNPIGRILDAAPTQAMVDRFLSWPLPASVCSDLCVTKADYPHSRIGTNLLTATEARQMLEHVLR